MKKILFIVLPVVLIGGGAVGAAMMGVINIPGLTPAKKKSAATAQYTEEKEAEPMVENSPPEEEMPPAPIAEAEPPPDLEKGRRGLAKLWNEMEVPTLIAIVADWKDEELAAQLRYLEPEKTAELLSGLKPGRASKLSRLLQEIVAKETEKTA